MTLVTRLVTAAALLSCAPALAEVPTGVRAASARAEAEAFAALEEKRDCDAARSFLVAHSLAEDGRLVINAALALERHGARAQAQALLQRVRGTPAAIVADVDARLGALASAIEASGAGAECPLEGFQHQNRPAPFDEVDEVDEDAAERATLGPEDAFLPAGITALASGLVVAGSTVGTLLWVDGVINDASSSGGAREGALRARDPVLWAGTSIASALVVAGALLVPYSLLQEPQ